MKKRAGSRPPRQEGRLPRNAILLKTNITTRDRLFKAIDDIGMAVTKLVYLIMILFLEFLKLHLATKYGHHKLQSLSRTLLRVSLLLDSLHTD